MSQPETSNTTGGGAEALLAASAGKGARRTRHVPTPKTKAPNAAEPGAQEPPAAPKPAAESAGAGQALPVAEKPAETAAPPVTQKAAPESAPPPAAEPEPQADVPAPSEQEPDESKQIAFPAKPLDYQAMFTPKPKSTVDPAILKMLTERQIKLLKSMRNVITMWNERQAEYAEQIRTAITMGMDKEEMMRLAVAHECEPVLQALLYDTADEA